MSSIVEGLCNRLRNPHSRVQDTLADCAELLRNGCFFDGKPGSASMTECRTFGGDLPVIDGAQQKQLVTCLASFIQSNPDHTEVGSAVACLKYSREPQLKPLLREVLKQAIRKDSFTLYQTIIALRDLGESLTPLNTSLEDLEANSRIAELYLETTGEN